MKYHNFFKRQLESTNAPQLGAMSLSEDGKLSIFDGQEELKLNIIFSNPQEDKNGNRNSRLGRRVARTGV